MHMLPPFTRVCLNAVIFACKALPKGRGLKGPLGSERAKAPTNAFNGKASCALWTLPRPLGGGDRGPGVQAEDRGTWGRRPRAGADGRGYSGPEDAGRRPRAEGPGTKAGDQRPRPPRLLRNGPLILKTTIFS